jgi:hypothetical protein
MNIVPDVLRFYGARRTPMVSRTSKVSVVVVMGVFGCSGQKEGPVASPIAPAGSKQPVVKQPVIVLAVEPPTDPKAVEAGVPLDVVCKVTVESGGFEPSVAIFQFAELKNKRKVFEGYTVSGEKDTGNSFLFKYHTNAPEMPGKFVIDAKVIGVDPTLPSSEPAQGPAADGTKAKQGARAEFSAPSLEIDVKE